MFVCEILFREVFRTHFSTASGGARATLSISCLRGCFFGECVGKCCLSYAVFGIFVSSFSSVSGGKYATPSYKFVLFGSFYFTFVLLLDFLEVAISCFTCHLLRNFFPFVIMAEPVAKCFVGVTDSDSEEILEACVPVKTKQATSGWCLSSINSTSSKNGHSA